MRRVSIKCGNVLVWKNLIDKIKFLKMKRTYNAVSYTHLFPFISDSGIIPEKLLPFDKAMANKDYAQWVHFYIHDRDFERIWNHPNKYLEILKRYEGVITPDFSLYLSLIHI